MHRATALVALVVAVVAGGCGTIGGTHRSGGQALFAQDCAVCHSLTGRQSARRQGGDLLALHVGRGAMLQFVQQMPVRHRLSSEQASAVAAYVLAVERRGRSG